MNLKFILLLLPTEKNQTYFYSNFFFDLFQCRYWGEQDGENINKATRNFFYEELGEPRVQFMDASKDLPWPAHHRQLFLNRQERQKTGWVLKLAAAYLVPFQEVLYLDADSALLVSPDSLFELKEYKQRGSLFWPDTPCQRPAIFNELINVGLIEDRDAPGPGERETESGQWLLDRHLHREALEYTMLLGTHAGYTFTKAFGDKVSIIKESNIVGLIILPCQFIFLGKRWPSRLTQILFIYFSSSSSIHFRTYTESGLPLLASLALTHLSLAALDLPGAHRMLPVTTLD